MKTLLRALVCAMFLPQMSMAAVAAGDIRMSQRNPQNSNYTDIFFPTAPNSLIGTSSGGILSLVTIGSGLDLTAGVLTATGGGGGAPTTATYITQTANAGLSNEQALSLLSSGIMRVATTTGVVTSLGDVLPFANGGTGQSSFIDGQLLIGNTATGGLTKATLTEGTTTWITNANGAVTISGALKGLTTGGVVDNAAVIQAAFPAGVARHVVLPKGTFLIASTITMFPGSQLIGQGDNGDGSGTDIIYTGTGRGVTIYATASGQGTNGGRIANIRFIGSAANLGLVSISDVYRVRVENCTFQGLTPSVSLGRGIELRNTTTWTEGSELLYNQFRDVGIHYKFTIDDDTDPLHLSFAETRIVGSSNILTGINDRVVLADAKSYIYSSNLNFKCNYSTDAAIIPTTTKAVLIELGNDASITDGKLYLFSEAQSTRPFTRYKLGTNAYISADGYQFVAGVPSMSNLVGATFPFDDMPSSSVVYLGPGGEYRVGSAGPSRLNAGEPIFAQKSVTAPSLIQAVYLSTGTARVNLNYIGTNQGQQMTILVSTNQYANSAPLGQGPVILDNHVFIGNAPISTGNPPYLAFTPNGCAVLMVDISNPSAGGILTITAELQNFTNAGVPTDFGDRMPMVLFPSGLTVGASVNVAKTVITAPSFPVTIDGNLLIGNASTGLFQKGQITAGTGISVTNGAGSITINATGSGVGDVTAAANFGTDNVLIKSDGITKGVQATGITIADTTNDMSGVGNITAGIVSTTDLVVSGTVNWGTTVMPVANGGSGRSTGSLAYSLIATGTTAGGTQQTLANGATTEILVGGGAAALPVWTTAQGSGAPVRATSPTLTTPTIGVATATSINGQTVTAGSGTLTLGSNTLTVSQATTLNRQSSTGLPVEFGVAMSDETTAITTGTAKVTFRAPYAFTVTEVRSSLTTTSSSGLPTVDINEAGSTILSTKLTIDVGETTSTTAVTPPVISDTAIADDAVLTFDVDVAGTGAAGLKVWIKGYR